MKYKAVEIIFLIYNNLHFLLSVYLTSLFVVSEGHHEESVHYTHQIFNKSQFKTKCISLNLTFGEIKMKNCLERKLEDLNLTLIVIVSH